MSYATQAKEFARTPQEIIIVGVKECQNFYATHVEQLLTRTEEIDNAAWVKDSVTVTPDTVAAPDGTMTADVVAINADNDAIRQTVSGFAVTSKAFTGSVFLKIPSGTATITLRVRNNASTEFGDVQVTVTASWMRFFVWKKFSGTPSDDPWFSVRRSAGDTINGDLHVWGANLYRNPGDKDMAVEFPYARRIAEASTVLATKVSRCSIPDQGDGNRCFYTWPTCQDLANYNGGHSYETTLRGRGLREHRYCRKDAPLPLRGVAMEPSLLTSSYAAQKIERDRAVTVNDRVTLAFDDSDPPANWNQRQLQEGALTNTALSGAGRYWPRFIAIHRNYDNPDGYLTIKRGFVEATGAESDYEQRGRFVMRDMRLVDRRAEIVCADRLKLTRAKLPSEISDTNILTKKISNSDTTIHVRDASELTDPALGFPVTIELIEEENPNQSEKCNVTARDIDANTLTVQRGRWGTVARSHGKIAWRETLEIGTERTTPSLGPIGMNIVDAVAVLYRRAGLTNADIDQSSFDDQRDSWFPSTVDAATGYEYGFVVRRSIVEATDVEELVRELRDMSGLMVFVGEDQMVRCRAFAPTRPGESPRALTDEADVIKGSASVDDNAEARLSRVLIAWELADPDLDGSLPSDFTRVRVEVDVDAENPGAHGDRRAKYVLSKWLRPGADMIAHHFGRHLIERFRYGTRFVTLSLEIKDDLLTIGDAVSIATAMLQQPAGSALIMPAFIAKKARITDSRIDLELLEGPRGRGAFYSNDASHSYVGATDTQKQFAYYADDNGMVNGDPGYVYG